MTFPFLKEFQNVLREYRTLRYGPEYASADLRVNNSEVWKTLGVHQAMLRNFGPNYKMLDLSKHRIIFIGDDDVDETGFYNIVRLTSIKHGFIRIARKRPASNLEFSLMCLIAWYENYATFIDNFKKTY